MNHRVISRRELHYPFKAYWACTCGTRLFAFYMGPGPNGLEAVFARHKSMRERRERKQS